jgi:MFS superfamily sulfate permease-like transporter
MDTVSIRIDDEVYKRALKKKRKYVSVTTHLSLLIEEALDMLDTMKRPPGRYSYSSNSSSFEELEKESMREKGRETFLTPISENFVCHNEKEHQAFLKEQKKVSQKDSPAFQIWWETYNAANSKASNQSKAKARTAWKEALKKETAENLIEAAKTAVKDQARKIGADEWVAPFPDAHRWLRDECYTVFLERITPTQPEQIISGVTVL